MRTRPLTALAMLAAEVRGLPPQSGRDGDPSVKTCIACALLLASGLARAAMAILAKLAAIVPDDLRPLFDDPSVGTPPPRDERGGDLVDIARLREWSRQGRKVRIRYRDEHSTVTERVIWPFMVGYVATIRSVMAWCETRHDFRIFRTDRITEIEFFDGHYPEHSVVLRRRWLASFADARRADKNGAASK